MDDKDHQKSDAVAELDAFERFQKFARALFRVDKRDVPKHEPKKRQPAKSPPTVES